MRIIIGSDHAGFQLRQRLTEWLSKRGHQVENVGPPTPEDVDYPLVAQEVGHRVRGSANIRGILICGSGVGMSMAANKISGSSGRPCTRYLFRPSRRRARRCKCPLPRWPGRGPLACRGPRRELPGREIRASRGLRATGRATRRSRAGRGVTAAEIGPAVAADAAAQRRRHHAEESLNDSAWEERRHEERSCHQC